jgi:2-polyprenyl-6-methoxyphenol hydroxylase-like FAD-dependent oxidoreductase
VASIDNVLVVGGGIAGMTLATSLERKGVHTEIVEVNPDWTVLGVGISLQGPALRALRTIGILDQCVREGFGYSKRVFGNAAGDVTRVVELPRICGPDYPATLGIMRSAAHSVLAEALRRTGTIVRLGLSVSSLSQTSGAVRVEFTDGTRGTYDLVVGADGSNSKVRQLIFGKERKPAFTGQAAWRAMVERPPQVDAWHAFYGPRNKTGFNPVSEREMYVFLVQNIAENSRIAPENLPARLREQLADFGGVVAEVRERIRKPDQIVYRAVESFIFPPPWYRGRVILIGDAVHPTTPHLASGAGLAVEDAIVLADLLISGLPVPESLEEFMARRYERCRMVVENSLQLGEWEKQPNAPGADPVGLIKRTTEAMAQPI